MKKLVSIVSVLLIMGVAIAQETARTVTIIVEGNRTRQISVDGEIYPINNTSATGEQSIQITDLLAGQHQLQIYRVNRTSPSTSSFTVRDGYDVNITITSGGGINISEVKARRTNGGWTNDDAMAPMSAAAFNRLYSAAKAKTSSSARANYIETELEKSDRMITSAQARKLIQLVNSESSRLRLAKAVYLQISDRNNFSQVSSLLNSSASKTQLNNYIATLPTEDAETTETHAAYVAMTPTKFNEIYNEVMAEPGYDRNIYLTNFFNKDYNYYTSSQVRQLLQTISSETERFNLAKTAYRGVTDRENYYSEIYQILTSSMNRSELRTYINKYDSNHARPAMTATAFNSLYQNIYNQRDAATRYNSVNTAFTTGGNYFTTAQAKQLLQMITDQNSRLTLAKAAYRNLVDRSNYAVLNDLFTYQSLRNDWTNYVLNFDENGTTVGNNNNNNNNTYGNTRVAMSDMDFNNLYRNVNNTYSASSKYTLIANSFEGTTNFFNVNQVRQLLMTVGTEADKLALAKAGYDNMVDQHNYTQLTDVFASMDTRNEYARYVMDIQSGGTGTSYKVAKSETEFKSIYRSIQLTFGLGAKMSSLMELFNKETNYFTVSQVKQLIPLVSSETNRLELAKLAYNNVVDPTNYSQLMDIFSLQSSRDELNAYIGTVR